MSFAELRQTVLQENALNTAYFAEVATFTDRLGADRPVTVKIAHRQAGPQGVSLRQAGPMRQNTVDELEQIEVLFSRDPSFAGGGLVKKPDSGDTFLRSQARDADRRPFVFAGEVVFEGDQHAVYVFQRPKRVVTGTRS